MEAKEKARWQAGPVVTRKCIVDQARARINRGVVLLVYWRILPPRWADFMAARLRCKGV